MTEPATGPSTPALDGLSARRRAFAIAFHDSPNATRSALASGYGRSVEAAAVTGSRLLRDPKVQASLEELRQQALEASGWDAARAIAALGRIAEDPAGLSAPSASVAAASRILDVCLPQEKGGSTSQHLHIGHLEPGRMRQVAQRLSAELGAPEPEPGPPAAN